MKVKWKAARDKADAIAVALGHESTTMGKKHSRRVTRNFEPLKAGRFFEHLASRY